LGKIVPEHGAGYDRKFESMSNQCCPIAIDFTVCTACCICRAGQSIIHMQYIVKSSLISFSSSYYLQKVLGCENIFENHKISYGAGIGL